MYGDVWSDRDRGVTIALHDGTEKSLNVKEEERLSESSVCGVGFHFIPEDAGDMLLVT